MAKRPDTIKKPESALADSGLSDSYNQTDIKNKLFGIPEAWNRAGFYRQDILASNLGIGLHITEKSNKPSFIKQTDKKTKKWKCVRSGGNQTRNFQQPFALTDFRIKSPIKIKFVRTSSHVVYGDTTRLIGVSLFIA